jgi:signal transduction histidine kinase
MWRQGLYHGIVGPAVGFGVFLVAAIGVAGTFAFFFWSCVQLFKPYRDHTLSPAAGLVVSACGLAGVVAVPWLVSLLTRADEETARRLLGPSPTVALTRRVEVLAASRAAAVEAADAERRRIERDLHDGAQQQLMSLSVNLGLARKTLRNVPDDAMRVIAEAHEQAKEAMAQLRDLVRGLHPGGARRPRTGRRAVGDRRPLGGPGAADGQRSGGAERLGGDGRVLRGVGALANVVKHSQASRATVDVLADAELGWLQVRVSDDGIGGADAARGSGLEGLRQRVATVDGTLRIVSPVGGPTAVTATLPCGG